MSALGLYASLALICAASAIVGQGVRAAWRDREWSWISPAVGLATLLVVGGLAIRLPGRAATAAVVLVVIVVAALALVWRRGVDARAAVGPGIAVLAAVVVAASLPFAAVGAFGALGPDVNWDIVTHEINAEWLRSHDGPEPPQIESGYPIGPHGLAATVSELTGAGLLESFTAILVACAVVAALAALALLRDLPAGRRTLACLLVGLPYLGASFYVQSAFKETLMGMLVLAFALGVREAAGEDRGRPRTGRGPLVATGAALSLLAAGSLQTYSYAGLAWLGATVGAWALAAFVAGRAGDRDPWPGMKALLPAAAAALVVLVLAAVADVPRLLDFVDAEESRFADTAVANLTEPIAPYEALGVWLESDYRFAPDSPLAGDAWAAIGLVALGLGVWQLARSRELALLAGVASVAAGWLVARLALGIYSQAKALAIAAPVLMLAALLGLLGPAWPSLGGNAARLARAAFAVVFVAGALVSSYLVLAGAKVLRDETSEELAELSSELDGRRVLFLGSAPRELYGLTPEGELELRGSKAATRLDFDTYLPSALDAADFVVTGRTPYASEPPPNFHRERTLGPFVLWERVGPTPGRMTLDELEAPGVLLDCSTPEGREVARQDGIARVFDPPPAHGPASAWTDAAGAPVYFPQAADGRTATQSLELTPGRWEISLQYMSPEPLEVTAPGLDAELPVRIETVGTFWPVGSIEVEEAGDVPFSVRVSTRPFLRRALGVLNDEPAAALGGIAATPVGGGRSTIPLREACGEVVDWYRAR